MVAVAQGLSKCGQPCTADYGPMKPAPTSQHTSGVNYYATSQRIHFEDLSSAVRAAADGALGSPVVRAAAPVTSGFTSAYAGAVWFQNGRQAFLKAAGPEPAYTVQALSREALVLEALAGQIPAVPMIGAGRSSDGGQVLALEWVEGHLPGFPWTDNEIALVRSACEQVSEVPTAALTTLAPVHVADDMLGGVELHDALTDGLTLPGSLDLLPRWLPTWIDEVVALAGDTDALRVENHLNHCDLRPDNLLIARAAGTAGGPAYLLDWNWVTLGPPWCDWVALIPSMQAQGHDLAKLLDSTPLSRSADPHALDVWIALVAVYMLAGCQAEPPPGTTGALRRHQRYYAGIFLDTLASHRGWL